MNVGRPGCAATPSSGVHGQGGHCLGEPTHTAVVRWRQRRCWVRVFLCRRHVDLAPDAEPMTARHVELLAARHEDWSRALAGLGYVGPPTSTDRAGV
ncbi:hypothetical protein [Pseudonocardia broussonetiae]|uniref:Uncharacterized protein n=1 Tax=Pseudonocardia broussonetiae TaxID=2736640 RepID=A0A6M6JIE8_9PSEU|nr:hypothetical protein [Pseudonocardia broussonetiae]QJY46943.1 hypothetical protein HOP40_14885 [Pseudonocardia broussonetiae]